MIYVLDTNVVSDFLKMQPTVLAAVREHLLDGDHLLIAPHVHYELVRGLVRYNATTQLKRLNEEILPLLEWTPLTDDDWLQAAHLWAATVSAGKQLTDMDLLLAALTQRLDATLVTADDDFDALPIKRVNWRVG
ncbi:MAG: PIN domain-containing protein [Chloroflexota bacterium]